MTQGSRARLAAAALAASLMLGTIMATDAVAAPDSRVSGITVSGTQAVGTFRGAVAKRLEMRKPEWFELLKLVSLMIGGIAGYALAIWTEPTFHYPGLIYRMIWAVSGMAVGALIYWALKQRDSN